MKRRSIAGPLLLIGIGALFLLRNVRPEIPLLDLFGRYWPLLLMAWGLFRLGEVFYWAASSRPLPRSGVSGGEWMLVLLICFLGSGVEAANRFSSRWPRSQITMRGLEVFGESYDFPVSMDKPCGKTPRVLIENLRGNARVTGADIDVVKVTGRKTIRAFERSDADRTNLQTPLEVVAQGDQIVVRTTQERAGDNRRISVDLEIQVPRGATVEGRGRYGDFDISEIHGSVDIDSDNAGVRLNGIGGAVRVDLRRSDIVRASQVKGAVEIRGRGSDVDLDHIGGPVAVNGTYTGELQFQALSKSFRFESSNTDLAIESVPGQVRLGRGNLSASSIVGPLRLTTKSNDVQITEFTGPLELSVDRGDIELRPVNLPLSVMQVRARAGDIEIAIPPAARFEIKASSERGDVQNDYGSPLKAESDGRGGSITGSVGPGPSLQLSTARGVITVRKGGTEPATPPTPPSPPKIKVEQQ